MRAVVSLSILLACVCSAAAQITVTLDALPDGATNVRIRNESAVDLASFIVRVNRVGRVGASRFGPLLIYYDRATDPAKNAIPPRQDHCVTLRTFCGRQLCGTEQPVVAGIFADGSTTGDPALLARLMLRRSNLLLAVETSIDTLTDAGKHNVAREQLIGQFRKLADSLNHWYLPPEQRAGREIYDSIVAKLRDLPEGALGSAFPPTPFVEDETAQLRRRRNALSESQPSLADATFVPRGRAFH